MRTTILATVLALAGCGGTVDDPNGGQTAQAEATAPAASPSARCSGSGCDGQWPDSSGCWNDGQVLDHVDWTSTPTWWVGPQRPWTLKLWWSPTCRTNWAEADATGIYNIHSQVLMHDTGRYKYVPLDLTNQEWGFRHWTKMYYAPAVLVRACGLADDGSGDPSQMGCTGLH